MQLGVYVEYVVFSDGAEPPVAVGGSRRAAPGDGQPTHGVDPLPPLQPRPPYGAADGAARLGAGHPRP